MRLKNAFELMEFSQVCSDKTDVAIHFIAVGFCAMYHPQLWLSSFLLFDLFRCCCCFFGSNSFETMELLL